MSFQKSTSGGDSLYLSRNGERTPLRTLHSDNLNDSTVPLTLKSKAELLKQTTENTFTCPQKNVLSSEIPAEHRCKQDDTHASSGMVSPRKILCTVSVELDSDHLTNYCADVTLKSYDCDGGEVEISDEVVGTADDPIPLPQPVISENSQHCQSLDSSNVFDSTGYCNTDEENPDHAYCRRESGSNPTKVVLDRPSDALGNMTFKFLNCTGGEIEIRNSIHSFDRTIPLPADQNGDQVESYNDGVHSSLFTEESNADHFDHPYFNTLESAYVTNQPSKVCNEKEQINSDHECKEVTSLLTPVPETECSIGWLKVDEASLILEAQSPKPLMTDNSKQRNDHIEEDISRECLIQKCEVQNTLPSLDASPSSNTEKSANFKKVSSKVYSDLDVTALALPQNSSNASQHKTILDPLIDVKEKDRTDDDSQTHSSTQPHQGSNTSDGTMCLSPPASVLTEAPQAENLPDVFKAIAECTPVHLKFLTPIVHRASLACIQARKELVGQFEDGDCGKGANKSVVTPDLDPADFWRGHLESPVARPLFNSTELVHRSQPCTITEPPKDVTLPQPEVIKPVMDIPVNCEGSLQQQLRQMAEFLMLASGKMGPLTVSGALPTKSEKCNACVGTSPQRLVNHSINTSGQFERKTSFTVEDQCTLTDPLLWNVPVDSLETVSRPELEQRVLSGMIIVEALVQQLAAARACTLPPTGAAPSELRDKTVQTEHTELSQTSMHRDLYLEALNRIKELEMDNATLQILAQYIENVKITLTALAGDTDAALCQMKQMQDAFREDHQSLVLNYGQMKSLLQKSRESQITMVHKVKDALQHKQDMHIKMEAAFSAKDAAYSVMDQLRKHCSMEISQLERCVESQQELLHALKKANPEQVAFHKVYTETLNFATELLSKTMEEQSSLAKELCTVRGVLQKCTPIILKLNEKADTALRDGDSRIAERDQALRDKEQTEEDLNKALENLQVSKGQIGDLNLQVTILTSEMGVLRQKLSESDEDRAQLDRKATELSATVSSTLASYAFLEQALASDTIKLQQSWADIKQAKERAQELESSLCQSEQRVAELNEALGHSEKQVSQLQSVSEAQALQLQQLQDMCSQLSGVRDMNEFLQMENELTREQIAESERMLRANLQSLRERNIQCEDLNGELRQLQHENKNLLEELDCVRTKFTTSQKQHKEKLEQIVTEIAILHHTVRGVTNELHASLKVEKPEQPAHNIFSVVVAPATEKKESPKKAPSDAVVQSELIYSETSAFTRISAITPKRNSSTEHEEEEQQSSVSELLVGLDSTVTELRNTLTSLQQMKDAQLQDCHRTISLLQGELEAAHNTHQTEVTNLEHQLSRLNSRMEKVNTSLQQKAQNETTASKLVVEISEIQETLKKHKADNNELRKEVVELRRSLQQSKSEACFLRDELRKNGSHSTPPADFMEEKISLLKEMERLKMSLQDEEQAQKKLLDRAKRHQAIYETNQQKSEKELQLLNNMLNKVRETLLSLPEPVKNCEQLQQLMEYVG